ncbi:hypothetical protein LSAT2_019541 [Lamellibrachia satsuma]|nr:hypothetical protein LSAT2_019541 [Lamellibrachia satsuma]
MTTRLLKQEEENFLRLVRVVLHDIPSKLQNMFKGEFANKYGMPYADDTASGQFFLSNVPPRSMCRDAKVKSAIQNGDSTVFDCTTLFYCLVYSGALLLPPMRKKNARVPPFNSSELIDQLREQRNLLAHSSSAEVSQLVFNTRVNDLNTIYQQLGWSCTDLQQAANGPMNTAECFRLQQAANGPMNTAECFRLRQAANGPMNTAECFRLRQAANGPMNTAECFRLQQAANGPMNTAECFRLQQAANGPMNTAECFRLQQAANGPMNTAECFRLQQAANGPMNTAECFRLQQAANGPMNTAECFRLQQAANGPMNTAECFRLQQELLKEAANKALARSVQSLRVQLQTVQGQLRTTTRDVVTVKRNLQTTTREVAAVKGKLDRTTSEAAAVKRKHQTTTRDVVAMKRRLQTTTGEVVTVKRKLETTSSEVAAVKNQLQRQATKLEVHEQQLQDFGTAQEKMAAQVHRQEQDNDAREARVKDELKKFEESLKVVQQQRIEEYLSKKEAEDENYTVKELNELYVDLLTSRPGGIKDDNLFHKTAEIYGLTPDKISEYISKFCRGDNDLNTCIGGYIRANTNIASLCYIPVQCDLVCRIVRAKELSHSVEELPATITQLYIMAVENLAIEHHPLFKGKEVEDDDNVVRMLREPLLKHAKLARDGMGQSPIKVTFSKKEIDALDLEKAATKCGLLTFSKEKKKKKAAVLRKYTCAFSFNHLTMQEFPGHSCVSLQSTGSRVYDDDI